MKEKWSKFICDRCSKRCLEENPFIIGCSFRCFDGVGSCYPCRPLFLKRGK